MRQVSTISVFVTERVTDASGAVSYELRPKIGELPVFNAGAHVDLYLPNGLIRSYSLMNSQGETDRYVIGVGLDKNSRGGSSYMHRNVMVGSALEISNPSNFFPLNEQATRTVMVAGGIGITPFFSMLERLIELRKDWELHLCARSRAAAPFLHRLMNHSDRIVMHFDDESNGAFVNIAALIAAQPQESHFYCCGPAPMMDAFENACKPLQADHVHMERFSSPEGPAITGGFTVRVSTRGQSVRVHPGQTILDALQGAGIEVPFSCLAGVCGTCQMNVLSGTPDHRDLILTEKEHAENKVMMVCCSGSLSEILELGF